MEMVPQKGLKGKDLQTNGQRIEKKQKSTQSKGNKIKMEEWDEEESRSK